MKKNRCAAILQIGDDYGDNDCTFRCNLEHGHDGPHIEKNEEFFMTFTRNDLNCYDCRFYLCDDVFEKLPEDLYTVKYTEEQKQVIWKKAEKSLNQQCALSGKKIKKDAFDYLPKWCPVMKEGIKDEETYDS
jgi:hypothetical protein